MKKFTLCMAAALCVASATAAVPFQKGARAHNANRVVTERFQKPTDVQGIKGLKPVKELNLNAFAKMSRAADEVIYEAVGETKMYNNVGFGFMVFWGYLFYEEFNTFTEIVWGEDGNAYIKDIVTQYPWDTYVKGTVADNEITVNLPQCIDEEYGVYVNILEFVDTEDGGDYIPVAEEDNKVVYTIDENGVITMQLNPGLEFSDPYGDNFEYPKYILAMTDEEGGWYGFGDAAQEMTIFDKVAATLPEDAQPEVWTMTSNNYYGASQACLIDVAIVDNQVWLGNLNEYLPDAWIVGNIEGDKIVIENGQYLGFIPDYGVAIYAITATVEMAIDEDGYGYLDYEFLPSITLNYDAAARKITATNPNDMIVLNVNANLDELYPLDLFGNPNIFWQDPASFNAAPLTPTFYEYLPYTADYEYGGITWDIPYVNENGAVLPTSQMYYHFIVDGEVYGIDPEEYPEVYEYMEDIPYDFTEYWDFGINGSLHTIYFYFDGAESFGMQSFFVNDEGETFASEVATYVPETSGVKDASFVQVLSTTYYNLMGQQIENPSNGIYIKSMKLANGETRTGKVIVK